MDSNSWQNLIDKVSDTKHSDPKDPLRKAKEEKELFEVERENKIGKHKNNIFIYSIYIFWVLAATILIVRLLHFVLPVCYQWLDIEQVQSLDKFLFSGSIGGILGKYGTKVLA